jgi:anti-sigma regulatory factor (Ser/Thr protein kinase)
LLGGGFLTTSPVQPAGGFRHEAAIFATDDELIATVVPFLAEGISAGEPTLLSLKARQQHLIFSALGDTHDVTVVPHDQHYGHPATALHANHQMFTRYLQDGAKRVRMVAEVPHSGNAWESWSTYEAVINHYYAALSLWGICLYDTREASGEIIDDVLALHPGLASPGAKHTPNDRCMDPASFLGQRGDGEIDPLEATEPDVVVLEPSPQAARRAVAGVAGASGLSADEREGLLVAVSEVVTNAILHGRPPVRLEAWAALAQVLVAIHDRGSGPSDPYAGLLPPEGGGLGGRGLWIAHQMCRRITLSKTGPGFTVRLVAGRSDTGPAAN